eukprot:scaffold1669_cov129-Cylindrotheca_fusiformis.AAC.53
MSWTVLSSAGYPNSIGLPFPCCLSNWNFGYILFSFVVSGEAHVWLLFCRTEIGDSDSRANRMCPSPRQKLCRRVRSSILDQPVKKMVTGHNYPNSKPVASCECFSFNVIKFDAVIYIGVMKIRAPLSAALIFASSFTTSAFPMPEKSERIHWMVRPSNVEDKDAVEALLNKSYENLLSKDYDAGLLAVALPKLCNARLELLTCSTWYVAEEPGSRKIVGCGGWTPKSPFGEDIPHLRHFATDPGYLRRGVARALWERTWNDWCAYAGKEEKPDMEVFSTLTAESFYESLGFEKMKEIMIPLGEDCPFPAIQMRRPNGTSQ